MITCLGNGLAAEWTNCEVHQPAPLVGARGPIATSVALRSNEGPITPPTPVGWAPGRTFRLPFPDEAVPSLPLQTDDLFTKTATPSAPVHPAHQALDSALPSKQTVTDIGASARPPTQPHLVQDGLLPLKQTIRHPLNPQIDSLRVDDRAES